ncbi:hypothetical protein [Rhodococcus jostii]|uniref:hypothetical protein n=1 Tax=Rhodococcus jostii TaxID=132919 RepID=UPI0036282245
MNTVPSLSPLSALVDAAAQHILIADDAAAAKWGTDLPINDPPRERQFLDTVTAMAADKIWTLDSSLRRDCLGRTERQARPGADHGTARP